MMELIKNNWLVLVILALALVLRLPNLNGSFWLDEAAQALESVRPLSQQLDIAADFQPPLIHLITHFAMYIDKSEWWLRTIAALIPGLVTIWATYKIGERLLSKKAGLIASFFLASSSFHIFYSQELRPYSLPAMWATLSWLVLIRITSNKRQKLSKLLFLPYSKTFLLYSVLTLLGLYSSYLYPFLLLSQVFYVLLMHRKSLTSYLIHLAYSILFFLPWVPKLLEQLTVGQLVRSQLPGWEKVVSASQLKSLFLVIGKFIYGVLDLDLSLTFIFTTLMLLIFLSLIMKETFAKGLLAYLSRISGGKIKKKSNFRPLLTLSIWFLVPLLSAWLISFWIPVLRPKRVLFLLPSFYLLLASSTIYSSRKLLTNLLLGLTISINILSTSQYYLNKNYQREDWRSLHAQITEKYPADSSLAVFSFPEPFAPWIWYDDGSYPTLATGQLHIDQLVNLKETLKPVNDYQTLVVFDYLRDLTDPENRVLEGVEAYDFSQTELLTLPNIGFVRIYNKSKPLAQSL